MINSLGWRLMNRFIVAATASLFLCYAASGAEIKLLASGATKEVCLELMPHFEQRFR